MQLKEKHILVYQSTKVHFDYYLNHGAPTLILLHGLLASKECFNKMIGTLHHEFSIVCIDLPPFGASEKKRDFDFSYRNYADLVMRIMNNLLIEKAAIIGHSMGGQIALVCARYYPNRILSLYLLAPSSYMKASDIIQFWIDHVPNTSSVLKYLFEVKGLPALLKFATYDEEVVNEELIERYEKTFTDDSMYNILIELFLDHPGDLIEIDLHLIHAPCYIVWGKSDQILPISIGEQLKRDLPHAEFYVLEKKGHLLPEEAPEAICEIIQLSVL
ncbi:alpha/beta fold hydrolase [Saliterribacillus persicus]|uniref:Pimeloyl-ACP methyl ester carboxylesterase n=1 Tax=Saliterribacillus persicus TaxID=930114 RepID=A0A368XG16_9BACI|nr:alpha/beta hydrolase [Saliterribacillus persicus]RCW66930.1 pimeloyl-ACP methyl ester carboxylesterase [Saliterribacillus persicus]